MRVAFFSEFSSNIDRKKGGAETQAVKTVKNLKKIGVDIDFVNEPSEAIKYDVINLFRIDDSTLDFFYSLPKNRPPIALTTIFAQTKKNIILKNDQGWIVIKKYWKYYGRILKGHKYGYKGYSKIKHMLESVNILLPNSYMEAQNIRDFFDVYTPFRVIPNGVDINDMEGEDISDILKGIPDDFVLSVGRIEERKNHLNVVRACKHLGLPLVIIGNAKNGYYKKYFFKELKKIDYDRVYIYHSIPYSKLISFYKKAKVHVLASWYETTGLSSLEAGYFGCQLVVSDRGATREYFQDAAQFCDPSSYMDIAGAIKRAWNGGGDLSMLKKRIEDRFNWRVAAEETLKAYKDIIKRG